MKKNQQKLANRIHTFFHRKTKSVFFFIHTKYAYLQQQKKRVRFNFVQFPRYNYLNKHISVVVLKFKCVFFPSFLTGISIAQHSNVCTVRINTSVSTNTPKRRHKPETQSERENMKFTETE